MSTPYIRYAIAGFASLSSYGRFGRQGRKFANATHHTNSESLPADTVLANLPEQIFQLEENGNWKEIRTGKFPILNAAADSIFIQWVSRSVHVQDRVVLLKALSDCRSEHKEKSANVRILNHDNIADFPQWVEFKSAPIKGKSSILIVARDISARKSLESELLEARDKADQNNISKTQFLANMSHELRTPLNAIIGFSEILKSGMVPVSQVEKHQEYNALIHQSAQHLLIVLNDILDMSKIEVGKYEIFPEQLDIVEIINSCCSMLMPLAEKAETQIQFTQSGEQLPLLADSKAIRQILINLLSNAIKFTSPRTDIKISVRRLGRKIEIKIKDHGKGISPEAILKLGRPFHQVDANKARSHEGTGLGLSIVKGLVDLHEGEFKIESELGCGTEVTVTFKQSLIASSPVPGDDADTLIRINPNPEKIATRMAG